MDQKRKFRLKILIIGDLATGKTSFVQRYIHDLFPVRRGGIVILFIFVIFCSRSNSIDGY